MTTAVRYTVWPGQQVHLAEEARGAVADDLVAGGVEDRRLALEDRDERVALVADLEQHLADRGGALLAVARERRELRRGEGRADGRMEEGYEGAVTPCASRLLPD